MPREIATHEFGCGLDGVIRGRGADVSGILNGVDGAVWDPAQRHRAGRALLRRSDLAGKARCKAALQSELGLARGARRAAVRRGQPADLAKGAGPGAGRPAGAAAPAAPSWCVQGTGDPALEAAFTRGRARAPRAAWRCASATTRRCAHRLIAGADVILVPSRFEPCGLTQLYGLRYGTLPVVRRVGGLADTVVDASEAAVQADRATGFIFDAGHARRAGAGAGSRPSAPTRQPDAVAPADAARHGAGLLLGRGRRAVHGAVPQTLPVRRQASKLAVTGLPCGSADRGSAALVA